MKKLMVLSLVMVFVLAYAGISMAGPWGDEITITANNDKYAELRSWTYQFGVAWDDGVELDFDGTTADDAGENIGFQITSNTPINLLLGLDPLTHTDGDTIYTLVEVLKVAGHDWQGSVDNNNTQYTRNNVQGQELVDYYLKVRTELADVHEQVAGDYEATFTLTIEAI